MDGMRWKHSSWREVQAWKALFTVTRPLWSPESCGSFDVSHSGEVLSCVFLHDGSFVWFFQLALERVGPKRTAAGQRRCLPLCKIGVNIYLSFATETCSFTYSTPTAVWMQGSSHPLYVMWGKCLAQGHNNGVVWIWTANSVITGLPALFPVHSCTVTLFLSHSVLQWSLVQLEHGHVCKLDEDLI